MNDEPLIVRAIVELKFKKPFDPFRIVTAKGEKLLVPEPERVVILPGDSVHVLQRSGRLVRVPKNEIVAIEELKVIACA